MVLLVRPVAVQAVAEHEVVTGAPAGHCGAFIAAMLRVLPFIDPNTPSALDFFKVTRAVSSRGMGLAFTTLFRPSGFLPN